MSPLFRVALFLCLSALPATAQESLADRLAALGATACDDSNLTCVTLPMPHDHNGVEQGDPIPVTFAVHLARGESRGVLLYNLGGPGYAALPYAESYIGSLDPELTDNFDIVFHDQRGVGPVHGIACPVAESAFAIAPLDPVADPSAAIATARIFVQDCVTEADSPLLNVVSTDQAAHDLELFRQAIGAPTVWVYGESYGTQLSQTYATLYPEAIAGVILDGVVDLNLTLEGFYATYVAGSDAIQERVFARCTATPGCAADFDGDPAAAFDLLASRLKQQPITVTLGARDVTLTSAMLETTAFYALYSPGGRTEFIRALAAVHRGNVVPMLRLAHASAGIDITTGDLTPDPDWYGGAYYAITCSDYAAPGATEAERTAAIITEAQQFIANGTRFARMYYAERLACALWPAQGPLDRPAQYAGGDWPTLVLTSDADPITPSVMAYAVADAAANAATVVMEGGPHVILGWDLACPDAIVTDLLVHGTPPAAPTQICEQDLLSPYTPLTLTGQITPLALGRALDTELSLSPTLYLWDYATPFTTGCDHGGTLSVAAGDRGTEYLFDSCALWPDVILDGKGLRAENGEPDDGLFLQLEVSGTHEGRLVHVHNTVTEATHLSGTWDGAAITTPRP